MWRVIGLGNYEEKYFLTPHNIGIDILIEWVKEDNLSQWESKKRRSLISKFFLENKEMELIIFKDFMNNSGNAFNQVFKKENEDEKEKIIVIQDDIDLPIGEIKISFGKNDGGHNGIKDIIKKIGTKKFYRIRIGVCPTDEKYKCHKPKREYLNNYLVYKKIPKKITEKLPEISREIKKIISLITKEDIKKTMNCFNGKKIF